MPTFDFTCAQCGHTFEGVTPFGSKTYPPCPRCGAKKVEKLLSPPPGIVFKGSGFYRTDSRGKDNEGRESGKGNDEGGKGGEDAKKSKKSASPSEKGKETP